LCRACGSNWGNAAYILKIFCRSTCSSANFGEACSRWQERPFKQEKIVIRFGLIEATTLSLLLAVAGPAMAGDTQPSSVQRSKGGQARPVAARVNAYNNLNDPNLPVENALRWGYSQGHQYYPSGFGGLYGDGRYPGNVISNDNHP
jgi:hypothetical protein